MATELGVMFSASGAVDPGESIRMKQTDAPWSLCRRPWSLMYITANGRVLPCCIAPFSMKGYGSFTLGDATQNSLREIWNGGEYQRFRDGLLSSAPPPACANCGCAGVCKCQQISVIIPALNEAESIGQVVSRDAVGADCRVHCRGQWVFGWDGGDCAGRRGLG